MWDLAYQLPLLSMLTWATWSLWKFLKPRNQHSLRSVAVVVLGDIGRSPRMMYHAQSFAENDFVTDVIGYGGSNPIPALQRLPKVQLRYLPEPPTFYGFLPFILLAPIKVLYLVASVLHVLFVQLPNAPEFILVQNPPTIPTLALVWLVGRFRGSKVIIDWHNLGYSILALKVGQKHPFVKIATWFEKTFGRTAYAHLFVTQAMHDFLVEKWDLQGHKLILHDRPPSHFRRATCQETHDFFITRNRVLSISPSMADFLPELSSPYSSLLTHIPPEPSDDAGQSSDQAANGPTFSLSSEESTTASPYSELPPPTLRPDRPAFLVSSTSWTPDEDFGIFLAALKLYEARAEQLADAGNNTLPKLFVIITGKGPLQAEFLFKVRKLHETWKWVRCICLWVKAEDYPIVLGSADLGVSMHSSSSALDLPMKVVDMFGCQLPVCALDFACLPELVKDGVNGLIFKDSTQLAKQLEDLLAGFPNSRRLADLRDSLVRSSGSSECEPKSGDTQWRWGSWEESWTRTIRPLVVPPSG